VEVGRDAYRVVAAESHGPGEGDVAAPADVVTGPRRDNGVGVTQGDRIVQRDGVDGVFGDVAGGRLQQTAGQVDRAGAERAARDAAARARRAGRHDQVAGAEVAAARIGVVRVLDHQGASDHVERAAAADDAAQEGRLVHRAVGVGDDLVVAGQ